MNTILKTLNAFSVKNLNLLSQYLKISKKSIKKSDIIFDLYKNLIEKPININEIDSFIKKNNINLSFNKDLFIINNNPAKQDLFIYINNFDFENNFEYYITELLNYKWKLLETNNVNLIFIFSNCIFEILHDDKKFIDKMKAFLLNKNVYVILANLSIMNDNILNFINETEKIFLLTQNKLFLLNSISYDMNNFYSFNVLSKKNVVNIHFEFNEKENILEKNICNLNTKMTFSDILTNKKELKNKEILLITCTKNILVSVTEIARKHVQIICESRNINNLLSKTKLPRTVYYYGNDIKIQNENLIKINYQTPLNKFKTNLIQNIKNKFKTCDDIYYYIGVNDKKIFNDLSKIENYELDYKSKKYIEEILKNKEYLNLLLKYIENQYEKLTNKLELLSINITNYKNINKEYQINDTLPIDVFDGIMIGLFGFNKTHQKYLKKNNVNLTSKIILTIKLNDIKYKITRSFHPLIELEILENNNIIQFPENWIEEKIISPSTFINCCTIFKQFTKESFMNNIFFNKFFTVEIKKIKKDITEATDKKILDDLFKSYINILVLNSIYEETKQIIINNITSNLPINLVYNNQWLYDNIPLINIPNEKFYENHLCLLKFYNKFIKTTQLFSDFNFKDCVYFQ